MLKIFLTGDNHIGLKYSSHASAAILSAARTEAFHAMIEKANSEHCDLFVIAGDLFENTYSITKKDISALLDILAGFNGIVAVLPGNHDYYDKDIKAWQYFNDIAREKDNIMLLCEYRPYHITVGENRIALYPALCTSLHSDAGENNLGWIRNESISADNTFNIGIAHGAVAGETIDREGQYFTMTREEFEEIPIDAWLIGHTHVPFPADLSDETATVNDKIFNAGTHVQTDVSCNSSGCCFIIEIDNNKEIRAKKFDSGNISFVRRKIKLSSGELCTTLENATKDLSDNTVVELILNGAVSPQEYENRHELLEKLLDRFIEGTYDDSSLSRLISEQLIKSEFPETSFSAKLLTELLEEPKQAQLMYELLTALKEGR